MLCVALKTLHHSILFYWRPYSHNEIRTRLINSSIWLIFDYDILSAAMTLFKNISCWWNIKIKYDEFGINCVENKAFYMMTLK